MEMPEKCITSLILSITFSVSHFTLFSPSKLKESSNGFRGTVVTKLSAFLGWTLRASTKKKGVGGVGRQETFGLFMSVINCFTAEAHRESPFCSNFRISAACGRLHSGTSQFYFYARLYNTI